MRIVVAGGGSGGHITPILAVAQALKSADNELHYVGLGEQRERELVATSGMTAHRIQAGKLRRYHGQSWLERLLDVRTIALNFRDVFKVAVGFFQSVWLFLRLRPERIFIKGGYVGLPVGLAAWCLRIPFVIHESDSVPGLANRVLARLTPYRASGFDIPGFINLGNPVRAELLATVTPDRTTFGITSSKPVILAFGGSLGSQQLNTVIAQIAAQADRYEIVHITGDKEQDTLQHPHYHSFPFLVDEMAQAYAVADLVVARAGANTLSELAALGKASIIVPHPRLRDQLNNASAFAAARAVVVVQQAELHADRLLAEIDRIFDDTAVKQRLEQEIRHQARTDAAQAIASFVMTLSRDGGGE